MVRLKHSEANKQINLENGAKKTLIRKKHFCQKCASAFKRTKTYKRWISKVSTKKRSKRTRRCKICRQRVNVAKAFKYYFEQHKHKKEEQPVTQERMQLLLQFTQLKI
jgi:hypothetical protein